MVLGFEIEPVGGGGWVVPSAMESRLMTAILGPKADVRLRVRRREGWERARWGFVTGVAGSEIELDTL